MPGFLVLCICVVWAFPPAGTPVFVQVVVTLVCGALLALILNSNDTPHTTDD